VAASVEETLQGTRGVVQNVDDWVAPLISDVGKTADSARSAIAQAESTLASVQSVTDESSQLRFEFTNALREISATARSLRVLTDYLQQNPDALLRGKGGKGGR
jgi:paraquat-inducible protein B